jgi:hypothetical protein
MAKLSQKKIDHSTRLPYETLVNLLVDTEHKMHLKNGGTQLFEVKK